MKFQTIFLTLALAAQANASADKPCRASCVMTNTGKECIFEVSRDQLASELGYFKFSGEDGDCGGTNPTIGIEKGATYYFKQSDPSNYYHALGFAYGNDGALADEPELEPGISGRHPGDSTSNCAATNSCPAPMYIQDGVYLGTYSNNPKIAPVTTDEDDFGLDNYEPQFFYPLYDWLGAGEYSVALMYPEDNDFNKDFFYFCHIHEFMTGRVKFIDANGDALYPDDDPALPYDYQVPSPYDESCGTIGLEEFQLPNKECPKKFVCNRPDGPVGKFAECVDSMNCAMLSGMTTNVNDGNAICLFNHQMIPHHQNAINMCKALIKSNEIDCPDLEDEENSACITSVICQEIINVQNAQIQTMRGVLDGEDCSQTDDCRIEIVKSKEKKPKKTKKPKKEKSTKAPKDSSSSDSDDTVEPEPTDDDTPIVDPEPPIDPTDSPVDDPTDAPVVADPTPKPFTADDD